MAPPLGASDHTATPAIAGAIQMRVGHARTHSLHRLPWERILQPSAARAVRMSLLQWLGNSGSVACTNCYGCITICDLRYCQPSRWYRLKVQARTSAGVTSSIALIPEEDHDEQDEQDKTTDDPLHERATGDRRSGVYRADGERG